MYVYADYAIGAVNKRNNIQKINELKLNGVVTDCYRSLFLFDEGLKLYVNRTGSISEYAGYHISDALVFDFEGEPQMTNGELEKYFEDNQLLLIVT